MLPKKHIKELGSEKENKKKEKKKKEKGIQPPTVGNRLPATNPGALEKILLRSPPHF